MSRPVYVHYLPQLVAEQELSGKSVAVIDLLRASTTIVTALANGATAVEPVLEVERALAAAERRGRANCLLGGEREGVAPAGFDLGNSPLEYTPQRVAGRHLILTTTNGTRAIDHARFATRRVIAAAVNRSAVAAALAADQEVHILCAGTDGVASGDDLLAAGALVESLMSYGEWSPNAAATEVHAAWRTLAATAREMGRTSSEQFALELRTTLGGRNLMNLLPIGHEADLAACAALDTLAVVPELDGGSGWLLAGPR